MPILAIDNTARKLNFGKSLARASDALAKFCAAEHSVQRHRNFMAQMRYVDFRCAIQLNTLTLKLVAAEAALVDAVMDAGGDVVIDGVCVTLDMPMGGKDRRERPRIVITYGY